MVVCRLLATGSGGTQSRTDRTRSSLVVMGSGAGRDAIGTGRGLYMYDNLASTLVRIPLSHGEIEFVPCPYSSSPESIKLLVVTSPLIRLSCRQGWERIMDNPPPLIVLSYTRQGARDVGSFKDKRRSSIQPFVYIVLYKPTEPNELNEQPDSICVLFEKGRQGTWLKKSSYMSGPL